MTSAIVVGAGLIGTCTAYALADRGIAVTVFENDAEPACQASFANGGMLTPSMADPWNAPGVWRHLAASLFDRSSGMLLRPTAIPSLLGWGSQFLKNANEAHFEAATRANFLLSAHSVSTTKQWSKREKLEFDFSDKGTLKIFRDPQAMGAPLKIARKLQPFGLRFEQLSQSAAIELEPALAPVAPMIASAIYYPDDPRGDARRFVNALSEAAKEKGVRFRFGTPVDAVIREKGRATGIVSRARETHADIVILAAGWRSATLLKASGLRLPIKPVKGYSLTFDHVSGGATRPDIAVVDEALHAAVVPLGTRLRVAGTAEFAGDKTEIQPARVANLRRLLAEIYPGIADDLRAVPGSGWAGLRPMSADGCPFIGAAHLDGLWVNAGHGHLGWTMAAGSADLLAALVVGGVPAVAAAPFAPTR